MKKPRYVIRVKLRDKWKFACAIEGKYILHQLREEAKVMFHCYDTATGVEIKKE